VSEKLGVNADAFAGMLAIAYVNRHESIHDPITPPHDDASALTLPFNSRQNAHEDSHPTSIVPCPAHAVNCAGRL
jgi:hypothetical protein